MSGGGGSSQVAETPGNRALAAVASDRYARYQQKYQPLETYAANDNLNNEANLEQQNLGIARSNYEQQYSNNMPQVIASNAGRSGQNLNSGAVKLGLAGAAADQGTSQGLGAVNTRLATQKAQSGNLQGLIDIGQGKSATTLQGYNSAAQAAQTEAITDAKASAAARNGILSGIGTGLGYGYGSFGKAPALNNGNTPTLGNT